MPRILLAAAVLLQAASLAQADLLVVNAVGGGDYLMIQDAIDAAADGDVILVQYGLDGIYNHVTVDGKGVVLVGEDGVHVDFGVHVRNVPAGSTVVIANLDVRGIKGLYPGQALIVEQCLGAVVVQDCDLENNTLLVCTRILQSSNVSFVRTDVVASQPPHIVGDCILHTSHGVDGVRAAEIQGYSTVYTFDSSFIASSGEDDGDVGGNGATACFVDADAMLFSSRTAFVGGAGGSGFFEWLCDATGGDGAPGLEAPGHASVVETALVGGEGGSGLYFEGEDAPPFTGQVFTISGLGRSLLAPSLVQAPADLLVELQGVGGDLAYLLVSSSLDPALILFGLLLAPAPTLIPLGALPPGGSLPLVLPLPPLPPGLEHVVLHAQGLFVDPTGATWPRLSGFSTLVWL